MQYGVHPWLSNHAGRQLDGAPSALDTLAEMRQHCPEVFTRCEVIVDGGVTRGTDIVKALALGAKAVGLGRPFLFSLVFGEAGVSKAIRILKHEMEIAMALLGVTSIDQLSPTYVSRLFATESLHTTWAKHYISGRFVSLEVRIYFTTSPFISLVGRLSRIGF